MRIRKKTAILALVVASVFQSTQAEDLLEIYQLAVQNDPQLRQSELNYYSISESERQAFSSFLPTITASASFNDSSGTASLFVDPNVPVDPNGPPPETERENSAESESFQITLSQSIYDHSNYTRLNAAQARVAQAEVDLLAAKQDLMIRVAERYLAVLTNQDAYKFTQAEQKANERQLEQAEQRYEVGLTAITDVHEARASFDRSRADVIVAKNTLDDSFEALFEITGAYTENLQALQGEVNFPPPLPANPDSWVEQTLINNPNVLSRKFLADAEFHTIRSERAGHLPTLDFGASYRDTTNTGNLAPFSLQSSDNPGFSLTLNVPIYSGGNVSSRTRQARFNHQNAMQQLEQEQRAATRAARNNYRAVIAGISQVEAFKQSVISAKSALEATEAGFEVGTRTIVDVLQSQTSLFQAQRDHSRARHDLLLDELQLQSTAGQISVEDLKRINTVLN